MRDRQDIPAAAMLVRSPSTIIRFAQTCRAQAYVPKLAGYVIAPEMLTAELNGYVFVSNTSPLGATDTAARRAFASVMSARVRGVRPTLAMAASFTAGRLLERAVSGVEGPLTSGDVLEGLYAIRGDTLDGLVPAPFAFEPFVFETGGNGSGTRCAFAMKVSAPSLVVMNGGKPYCG